MAASYLARAPSSFLFTMKVLEGLFFHPCAVTTKSYMVLQGFGSSVALCGTIML
jgi:hypothetical protein